ncbi:MAG TPA: cytochrome c biogenesis protein CcsA [Dongiaceae bacterium]|nr:cytochrome c biogenesis protein CcsA [Dongiaceae bacterium]
MSTFPIAAIVAVFSLLPLSILACRGRLERNALGWLLLAAAVIGGSVPAIAELQSGWRAGLAASLHVTAAAILVVFAASVVLNAAALHLAALAGPYAMLLVLLGWLASAFEVEPPIPATPGAWFTGHVLLSIAAYAALSLAALAACGVLLEERAFKARTDSWSTRVLPPLAEIEGLQNALLKLAAILLLLALATGAANEFLAIGRVFEFNHKILLSFLGFGVVLILLILHHRTGLRGRKAARWLLTGYLLLTLAYPGVKFVREILIGQG